MAKGKSIKNLILAELETSPTPLPASVIYHRLSARGISISSLKATVSRMVSNKELFRAKLAFANGNTLLSVSPDNFMKGNVLRNLLEEDFLGRPSLTTLVKAATSLFAVNKFDIAKLACLKIGRQPDFNWNETMQVVDGLMELGILRSPSAINGDAYWAINHELLKSAGLAVSPTTASRFTMNAKMRSKLSESCAGWLSRSCFVSAKGSKFLTNETTSIEYCSVPFDFLGFSFLNGLARRAKDTKAEPKVIVGDVVPDMIIDLSYAESFKRRVGEAYGVSNQVPLSFILGRGYQPNAFDFLKKEGYLVWTVENLLGKGTDEAIRKILETFDKLSAQASIDPHVFAQAISGLENFGSVFGNLKGTLLEMIVGYLLTNMGYNSVRLSVDVDASSYTFAGTTLDVDVLASNRSEAIIVECKAMANGLEVPSEEVRKHFERRTPAARDYLNSYPSQSIKSFRSIVVTTGKFSSETVDELNSGSMLPRKDTIFELWDRTKLLSVIRDRSTPELAETIERFFN